MSKLTDVAAWMNSGEYLPKFMRDFHDQKDVFKAIHQTIDVKGHSYAKDVDWVTGQCYVVDIFLWYMAKRGYTLQKTHRKGDFNDLAADIAAETERRRTAQVAALKSSLAI